MAAIPHCKLLSVDTDLAYDVQLYHRGVKRRELLGRGAYGVVCKMAGGVVKLQSPKRVERARVDQEYYFKLACMEARILCDLSERGISVVPKVKWALIGDRRVAIGMEETGSNICEAYFKQGFLPTLNKIRKIARRWLIGLGQIHRAGVIHCDLKPTNLTMKYILDFGISQRVDNLNQKRLACSRWYRPPEVILGLGYTTKIDLFSLGAVLYELYTGYNLFPVDNQRSYMLTDLQHLYHFLDVMEKDEFPESLMENARDYCVLDEKTQKKNLLQNEKDNRIEEFTPFLERMKETKKERRNSDEDFSLWMDLLKKLLEFDPEKRLSAQDALKHPFFAQRAKRDVEEDECKESPPEEVKSPPRRTLSAFETPNPFAALMDEEMRV